MHRALVAALVIVVLGAAGAPSPAPPFGDAAGCSVIGYRRDDRLLRVPVQINGTPLWFDIDTGARHSVIDRATAKRLRLQILRTDQMGGAGHGTQTMLHAAPLTIAIGGVQQRIADPWVIDLSHTGTNNHLDGLIGMEFFKAYIVRIEHVWGPSGDQPALGMEILRRFILTFDVPHARLTLQPTPQLNDPVPSPAPN